jgi:hypothetical protein
MKRENRLINLILLSIFFGVLVFTASDYVNCSDDFPDEVLDFMVVYESPVLPILSLHLNLHPYVLTSLKVFYLDKINLQTSILLC